MVPASSLTELIAYVVYIGIVAAGGAVITQALPWPKSWKARKPLGCPTCLGWWWALGVSVVVGGAFEWSIDRVGSVLAAAGIAAFITAAVKVASSMSVVDGALFESPNDTAVPTSAEPAEAPTQSVE